MKKNEISRMDFLMPLNIEQRPYKKGDYTRKHPKSCIVINNTNLPTLEQAWRWYSSSPANSGPCYIIDRSGLIVECYSPDSVSVIYTPLSNNSPINLRCIAIELVCEGPNPSHNSLGGLVELGVDFRGQYKFEGYTEAQLKSLKLLIGKLMREYRSIRVPKALELITDFNPLLMEEPQGIITWSSINPLIASLTPQEEFLKLLKSLGDFYVKNNRSK